MYEDAKKKAEKEKGGGRGYLTDTAVDESRK